jgi:iron-sulfur cluster repair protein YtfE (RIC family)
MVTGAETVAEIAERSSTMREILHRYGLDLCCGGGHPLFMAAQAHGVDLQTVLAELNAIAGDDQERAP